MIYLIKLTLCRNLKSLAFMKELVFVNNSLALRSLSRILA